MRCLDGTPRRQPDPEAGVPGESGWPLGEYLPAWARCGQGGGFANISCHRAGRNCGFKIENIGGRVKIYGMLLELFVVLRPVRRLRGRESNG